MDDPSRNTKSLDDMVFDKVNKFGSFNFDEQYSFYPLGEVIGYYKYELMTSCR